MLSVVLLLLAAPEVEVGVFAARPAALTTGELFGPSAGVAWAFEEWSLGLEAQLGFASENDLAFAVDHTELRTLGVARWLYRIGRGELSLGAGAGVAFVHEARSRHQADRLEASGLELSSSGSSAGPLVAFEVRVAVGLVAGIALVVQGGPSLVAISGDDEGLRLGWSAGLGLKKAFGDDDTDQPR